MVQLQITFSTELSFSAALINCLRSSHHLPMTQSEQPFTLLHSLPQSRYLLCLKDPLRLVSPSVPFTDTTHPCSVSAGTNCKEPIHSKTSEAHASSLRPYRFPVSATPAISRSFSPPAGFLTTRTVQGQGWVLSLVSHLHLALAAAEITGEDLLPNTQLPPDNHLLNSQRSPLPYT